MTSDEPVTRLGVAANIRALLATINLLVFPNKFLAGLNGPESEAEKDELYLVTPTPLLRALLGHHDTDAHCAAYVTGELDEQGLFVPFPVQPRQNKAMLPYAEAEGLQTRIQVVLLDIDLPGHAPWTSAEQAKGTIDAVIAAHGGPEGPLHGAGFYSTRSGYRIVFALSEPVPAASYEAFVRRLVDHIEKETGLVVDRGALTWNCLYRLPFVARDDANGVPRATEPYVRLDTLAPLDPTPWRHSGDRQAPVRSHTSRSGSEIDTDRPDDAWVEELLTGSWPGWESRALRRCLDRREVGLAEQLRAGEVPFAAGERHGFCLRTVAAIAGVLRCSDPVRLYARMFWTIRNHCGPNGNSSHSVEEGLRDLWSICVEIAQKEDAKKAARRGASR